MINHEQYMHRCLQLAKMGAGFVAPNPMVGAVLVHDNRIIGEGYHKQYGQAHAEVNCINSVPKEDEHLIASSAMYVSLEPCAHYGKTPPCADLIIEKKIPHVVVGCRDPFKQVDGKGIEKLKAANIDVIVGILEKECKKLNKRFFTFHMQHRPYIILKWAQTADGFIGSPLPAPSPPTPLPGGEGGRLFISNEDTNRLVHKWRSEEASILVGTNTALMDDPALTNRLWPGPNPIRMIVDMDLRLPAHLKIFDGSVRTIIFNSIQHSEKDNLLYYQVTKDVSLVHQIVHALYQMNIQSVLVEGGARLLQSFIDEEMWDECRVITNQELKIKSGLPSPIIETSVSKEEQVYGSDTIRFFYKDIFSEYNSQSAIAHC